MKDIQELLDRTMRSLKKHASLAEIERATGSDMHLYHTGHVNAYNDIASSLVRHFGCKVENRVEEEDNG